MPPWTNPLGPSAHTTAPLPGGRKWSGRWGACFFSHPYGPRPRRIFPACLGLGFLLFLSFAAVLCSGFWCFVAFFTRPAASQLGGASDCGQNCKRCCMGHVRLNSRWLSSVERLQGRVEPELAARHEELKGFPMMHEMACQPC